MKVLIAGDYYPSRRAISLIENNDDSIISEEIKVYIKSADYSIINYESPITDGVNCSPIVKDGPNIRSSKKAAAFIKETGFNMATLANNHILDFGEEAMFNTKDVLDKLGLDSIGVGINSDDANKVFYKQIGSEILAIINCCEHEFSVATKTTAGANPINPINQYYSIVEAKTRADYVLIIVHGGNEHYQLPSLSMVETYRFFIDAGADVVVNHHQHCYSGYEKYNNGYIFYGLGNFCFDKLSGNDVSLSKWNEGYMLHMTLEKESISFELLPYVQFANKPSVDLMTDIEKKVFQSSIKKLNTIISNPSLLIAENEKWMNDTSLNQRNIILPYNNKYLRFAASKGMLPARLSKFRMTKLLNILTCQSHRDRMIHFLRKSIQSN